MATATHVATRRKEAAAEGLEGEVVIDWLEEGADEAVNEAASDSESEGGGGSDAGSGGDDT